MRAKHHTRRRSASTAQPSTVALARWLLLLIEAKFCNIPRKQRDHITAALIPPNVHPEHNVGRRRTHVKALLEKASERASENGFADAAALRRRAGLRGSRP
ncbi:hypothetical protein HPB50_023111 [Hyalomma asiaticum]|uniref:Uncharacterized protein n=1 Tax=Hyalomma asiaticum TaxID=266040 RepID=A0ACB7TPK4_HYAAI|nr:hypothetical protein HPB50_023111 [Hyalomma asiaticum]